jgi:SAM-dependent methyltransferase
VENYSSLTVYNQNTIKRWSHRRRFIKALKMLEPATGDRILDFGSGDGYLVTLIKECCPGAEVVGFDPYLDSAAYEITKSHPGVKFVTDLTLLNGQYFDKVFCLETLEHFEGVHLEKMVSNIYSKLTKNGRILISVPIEIGMSALVKRFLRLLSGQPHPGENIMNTVKSIFGRTDSIERVADVSGYIPSHIGFDFRTIPKMFEREGLFLKKSGFSPLSINTFQGNSQVFYLFEKSAISRSR